MFIAKQIIHSFFAQDEEIVIEPYERELILIPWTIAYLIKMDKLSILVLGVAFDCVIIAII